jgi:hypothetical protein
MTFNIETKFNIGDRVYVVDHYDYFYAANEPYIISDIVVNINNRGIRTMYCVEQNNRTTRFPAEWLFDTYEECTKWCKEHNESL